MTETTEITETVDVGNLDTGTIKWLFNGQPIEDFRNYDMEMGEFIGDAFLNVTSSRHENEYTVTVNTSLLFGEDLSL